MKCCKSVNVSVSAEYECIQVCMCAYVRASVQVFLLKPNDKLLPATAALNQKQRERDSKSELETRSQNESQTNNVNNSQKLIYTFVVSVTLYMPRL